MHINLVCNKLNHSQPRLLILSFDLVKQLAFSKVERNLLQNSLTELCDNTTLQ